MTAATVEYLEPSQVARELGVSVSAVKMWERRKTIAPPLRTIGGQRLFTREQVESIRAARKAAGNARQSAARI
jgi:DNA-binding transcriptional MerR regulator